MRDTGLDKLKILRVERGGGAHEAFMDTADGRFCVLHTGEGPEAATGIADALTDGWPRSFDRMWLHRGMLGAIREKAGNAFEWTGAWRPGERRRGAGGAGPAAAGPVRAAAGPAGRGPARTAGRYGNASVRGGADGAGASGPGPVGITYAGCFATGRGGSVHDHLDLVGMSKDVYSGVVAGIEECRQGAQGASGSYSIVGRTVDFTFEKPLPDLPLFIESVFDTAKPFKLWGLDSKLEDGYFDVVGIDLHTGDAMNFEVTKDFMRVYLSKGSCGNTVLRLLTHLQLRCDVEASCKQVDRLLR